MRPPPGAGEGEDVLTLRIGRILAGWLLAAIGLAGCAVPPAAPPAAAPTDAYIAQIAAVAPAAGVVLTRPALLRLPWDVAAQRARWAQNPPATCLGADRKPLPDPVAAFDPPDFFVGRRKVDPATFARYRAATETARRYKGYLVVNASAFLRSAPGLQQAGECVIDGLDAWAKAGGLLGRFETDQGEHERKFLLAAVVSAYAPVAEQPWVDPVKRARIDAWVGELARRVMAFYDPEKTPYHNNHAYWAAYAVMLAGVTLNDDELFDWGKRWYDAALEQIAADGSLPLESARGKYALTYHTFALNALVSIAELGEANGQPLFAADGYRIGRLADFVLKGLRDPERLARLAGAPQSLEKRGCGWYVWMAPYEARFKDWRLVPYIDECKGQFARYDLLTDVTALYTRQDEPLTN